MELQVVFPAIAVIIAYTFYKVLWRRNPKEPPCFPSLPVIGSLPFLVLPNKLHLFLTEKTKKYGNVFSFYAGSNYTVVVNGYEAIREALLTKSIDFAGRGPIFVERHYMNNEGRGILTQQYGEQLKKNRTQSLAILKQFGFGDPAVMERKIQDEVEELIKFMKSKSDTSWNPNHVLELAALNVVHNMMFSKRLEYGDPSAEYLTTTLCALTDACDPLFDMFPLLAKIGIFRKWLYEIHSMSDKLMRVLEGKIKDCAKLTDSDDNFVKEYIEKNQSNYNEKELSFILRDFFNAGMETTSLQLSWCLIMLGNHHEIQQRLQKDIDSVVPSDRLPSIGDKGKLPYLEATILEVMRIRTAVPLSLPHTTLNETELCGYIIRPNSLVLINLWSAHMDPEAWPEPEKFRPERFLDDKENIVNRERMITFSLGKRACLGEVLARQEVFLVLAAILQQFNILPPEGQTCIRDKIEIVRGVSPAAHELRLVPRL
jgi:cytochrome P450